MAKHRIFTVGFDLPGDEFEYIEFESDTTLLDADIILFEPTIGNPSSYESYNGKTLLSEYSSFSTKQHLDHWRSEIVTATKAGKLVIVYLAKPRDCYRYTGQKQHSGTGKSRVATNIVTETSSYEAVPNLKSVTPKSGTEIQLDKDAKFLAPYWSEFSSYSSYEAEIQGDFKRVLLRSRAGDRTLGAAIQSTTGMLMFLPPLRYDRKKFVRFDEQSDKSYWTEEALQFGKRLASTLGALATSLKHTGQETPPPAWIIESRFRLDAEGGLEIAIAECITNIASLQVKKVTFEAELRKAGSLRRLLFEQGKPLEAAIIEALRLLGFEAQPFSDGESEFDSVFVSPEGRCLGEAEGKDNKAINIDKFSQLERNLQEDFGRDDVIEYAKGVLFGNAFRLFPVEERGEFFTEKCISAAKRVKVALIRTPDMFAPSKYMKKNPGDAEFAKLCREAIFQSDGDVVIFPSPPTDETSVLAEEPATKEGKQNNI